MNRRKSRKGFTLIEIMIVLAIIALLMAMVGPRLLNTQKKADLKATAQQIENLEATLKLFAVDNRTFPSTEEGLGALLQKPTDEQRSRNWDGPYLDEDILPVDPWGNAYKYEYPPTQGKRDFPNISSFGPDGQENTEDDIVNWTKESADGEAVSDVGSSQP